MNRKRGLPRALQAGPVTSSPMRTPRARKEGHIITKQQRGAFSPRFPKDKRTAPTPAPRPPREPDLLQLCYLNLLSFNLTLSPAWLRN